MNERLDYASVSPAGLEAMRALDRHLQRSTLGRGLIELVKVRSSQLNGCAFCIDMHTKVARAHGETEQRLYALSAWRETPYFTDAERAALALTEATTRISDRADPVPDDVWEEATRHYDEKALAALLVNIATINAWNRLNVPVRQMAGAFAA